MSRPLLTDVEHVALMAEFHGRHLATVAEDHVPNMCPFCCGYEGFMSMSPEERQLAQADLGDAQS